LNPVLSSSLRIQQIEDNMQQRLLNITASKSHLQITSERPEKKQRLGSLAQPRNQQTSPGSKTTQVLSSTPHTVSAPYF